MRDGKSGFTLVELLVVIAIIGILSSVAIVNLNSARDKAKAASVQAALGQLTSAIILCFDEEKYLTYNGANTCPSGGVGQAPVAGAAICVGSTASWPDVGANNSGWSYVTWCQSNYNVGSQAWVFGACSTANCTGHGRNVWCTATGCVSGIY